MAYDTSPPTYIQHQDPQHKSQQRMPQELPVEHDVHPAKPQRRQNDNRQPRGVRQPQDPQAENNLFHDRREEDSCKITHGKTRRLDAISHVSIDIDGVLRRLPVPDMVQHAKERHHRDTSENLTGDRAHHVTIDSTSYVTRQADFSTTRLWTSATTSAKWNS